MINNSQRLNAAVALALADVDFMGDTSKVNKAIDALTSKDDVTKRLNQSVTYGEKDWALAFADDKSDKSKKVQHIYDYIMAPKRAYVDITTISAALAGPELEKAKKAKAKAVAWLAENFPEQVKGPEEPETVQG